MNTTLTIKTPKKLRDDAKRTAHKLGVPLTTAVNAMLAQFVRDQRLVLEAECPYPSHMPNAETRRVLAQRGKVHKNDQVFKTSDNLSHRHTPRPVREVARVLK